MGKLSAGTAIGKRGDSSLVTNAKELLAMEIEGDFIALLDDWFSLPETWDNELDQQIAEWYTNPPTVWPNRPYFSPSSLGDCPRELYMKAKRAKRDSVRKQPHQGRWAKLGTLGGDLIQRELLAIERNYERLTGNTPRFRFLRNDDGTPMFEDFAKTNKLVRHDGEQFYLYGAPDGIMEYITDEGEVVRVGLEIKSKQTTPARTSVFSMREAEKGHADQAVCYAEMFGCDYYLVFYLNYAKQSWSMTDEQYEKTPDIRAFCLHVTDEDKARVFDKAAMVTRSVREGTPPKLDLSKWTFNNFKTACATSLTGEEVADLESLVDRANKSSIPDWRKRMMKESLVEIKQIRGGSYGV